MKKIVLKGLGVLIAGGLLVSAAPAMAADVVVDDRKMDRALDDAVDALKDLKKDAGKSDLRRRDQEDLEKSIEDIEEAIDDVQDELKDGKRHDGGVIVNDRALLKDLDDAIEDTEDLIKDIKDLRDDLDRKYDDVMESAEEVEKSLDKAKDILKDADKYVAKKDEPKKPAGPAAVENGSFQAMLQQAKGEDFDNQRLAFVKGLGKANWFTADQITALLKTFDFDNNRADAAIALFSRCVDQGNWFKIYGTFEFDSNKNKVRKAVGQ